MLLAATEDFWRWHPHPEVWVLVASLVVLYVYAVRVIGPKVVPEGQPVVTRAQKAWFTAAILSLWVAADWPMHDIGENYLYFVHMMQHMILTLIMPPMFLLSLPRWLADLVIGQGLARRVIRKLARPVVAGVLFNAITLLVHWPAMVNASVQNGPLHFSLHMLIVTSALLMWTPVCGPWTEWRMSLPGQMIYLFLMSVVPTVPGAWLTMATNPLFSAYDKPARMWGISAVSDQQAAGLIMKLGGGMYLWAIITTLFFKWAMRHEEASRLGIELSERDVLTFDQVQKAFKESAPVPEPRDTPPRS